MQEGMFFNLRRDILMKVIAAVTLVAFTISTSGVSYALDGLSLKSDVETKRVKSLATDLMSDGKKAEEVVETYQQNFDKAGIAQLIVKLKESVGGKIAFNNVDEAVKAISGDIMKQRGLQNKINDLHFELSGDDTEKRHVATIDIYISGNDRPAKSYVVKTPARPLLYGSELRDAKMAGSPEMRLGPAVIYSELSPNESATGKQYLDGKYESFIVEEKFNEEDGLDSRGHNLSPLEQRLLGKRLAEKVLTMIDKDFIYDHHFKDHVFIIGSGDDIDIRFIDWERVRSLSRAGSARQFKIEELLGSFIRLIVEDIGSEVALANFISQIKRSASVKSKEESKFYNEVLTSIRAKNNFAPDYAKSYIASDKLLIKEITDALLARLESSYIDNIDHGKVHAEGLIAKAAELEAELIKNGLIKKGEMDWRILTASIILHDLAYEKEPPHGRESAVSATGILKDAGLFSAAEIESVIRAIQLHDDFTADAAVARKEVGLEAQILFDVDQLDAFGVKGVYRFLAAYFKRGKDLAAIKNEVLPNIEKRFNSLTFQESKELGWGDYEVTLAFFDKLKAEEDTDSIKTGGATAVANLIKANLKSSTPSAISSIGRTIFNTDGARFIRNGANRNDIGYTVNFFNKLSEAYGVNLASDEKPAPELQEAEQPASRLERGWVIANHILVSFHAAFISSVLSLSDHIEGKWDVLEFMFTSPETIVSTMFWYATFHLGIAWHERGHYLEAIKQLTLNEKYRKDAEKIQSKGFFSRLFWNIRMIAAIPWGKFPGVIKHGITYYPDSPYNLTVSAAGPRASKLLGTVALTASGVFLTTGLILSGYGIAVPVAEYLIYAGRLFLGLGAVGILDFMLADPGQYKKLLEQERRAGEVAKTVTAAAKGDWASRVKEVKEMMINKRIQEVTLPIGGKMQRVRAPWGFRNSAMGGRHTEKEFPESNISMQEGMFVPLSAKNYEEAQAMTVALQNRLKQIIEKTEGSRVMGIGLEGGLAAYITKDEGDVVPEQKMWRMMKQAIIDNGWVPGVDVAIAFDPAASELENAYREEYNQPAAVGQYLFWRDSNKVVMTRDELLELYRKVIEEDDLPVVSIEDGFAEDDHEGWKNILAKLGDKIFIIGDDLVTTRDSTIEYAADEGLINTALIKANQIGTLSETILAMLVALGKGKHLVVSHRSKSPNDDMEAQVAMGANAEGIKAGGGANTERLFKYQAITRFFKLAIEAMSGTVVSVKPYVNSELEKFVALTDEAIKNLEITDIIVYEEPTNAGIPTVGIEIYAGIKGSEKYGRILVFKGSTPLGTSAGTGEAIHLIDSVIEKSALTEKYVDLFKAQDDGTYRFKKDTTQSAIDEKNDAALSELYRRAMRYEGKGVLNAVDNAKNILAPLFVGKKVSELGNLADIDRTLLALEKDLAIKRGKLAPDASMDKQIEIMQRKGEIGMNAILSMSLAVARLRGAVEGKDLWAVIRESMEETMAKTIAAELGDGVWDKLQEKVSPEVAAKVKAKAEANKDKPVWMTLRDEMSYDDLVLGLQVVNSHLKRDSKKLYEALRKQLLVYEAPLASDKKEDKLAADELTNEIVAEVARRFSYTELERIGRTVAGLGRDKHIANKLAQISPGLTPSYVLPRRALALKTNQYLGLAEVPPLPEAQRNIKQAFIMPYESYNGEPRSREFSQAIASALKSGAYIIVYGAPKEGLSQDGISHLDIANIIDAPSLGNKTVARDARNPLWHKTERRLHSPKTHKLVATHLNFYTETDEGKVNDIVIARYNLSDIDITYLAGTQKDVRGEIERRLASDAALQADAATMQNYFAEREKSGVVRDFEIFTDTRPALLEPVATIATKGDVENAVEKGILRIAEGRLFWAAESGSKSREFSKYGITLRSDDKKTVWQRDAEIINEIGNEIEGALALSSERADKPYSATDADDVAAALETITTNPRFNKLSPYGKVTLQNIYGVDLGVEEAVELKKIEDAYYNLVRQVNSVAGTNEEWAAAFLPLTKEFKILEQSKKWLEEFLKSAEAKNIHLAADETYFDAYQEMDADVDNADDIIELLGGIIEMSQDFGGAMDIENGEFNTILNAVTVHTVGAFQNHPDIDRVKVEKALQNGSIGNSAAGILLNSIFTPEGRTRAANMIMRSEAPYLDELSSRLINGVTNDVSQTTDGEKVFYIDAKLLLDNDNNIIPGALWLVLDKKNVKIAFDDSNESIIKSKLRDAGISGERVNPAPISELQQEPPRRNFFEKEKALEGKGLQRIFITNRQWMTKVPNVTVYTIAGYSNPLFIAYLMLPKEYQEKFSIDDLVQITGAIHKSYEIKDAFTEENKDRLTVMLVSNDRLARGI